jgi:hypothetical protein
MTETILWRREKILDRMAAIAARIEDVEEAGRNLLFLDASTARRISVLEGEEIVSEEPFGNRKASDKSQVLMIPEVLISCGASRKDLGSDLSMIGGRVIKAMLTDAELLALTVNSRSIRYGGMTSDLAFLALMEGKMSLKFRILYPLDPTGL